MSDYSPKRDIEIEVSTWLYPTENPDQVRKALATIMKPVQVQLETPKQEIDFSILRVNSLITDIRALEPLYRGLRIQKIIESARKHLQKNARDNSIIFYLNKQAAVVGQIHFCMKTGESPLGSIELKITTTSPGWFIDWLTPETKAGRIVKEIPPVLQYSRGQNRNK